MPTEMPQRAQKERNVVPASVQTQSLAGVDPKVQQVIAKQNEAINSILKFLNATFQK